MPVTSTSISTNARAQETATSETSLAPIVPLPLLTSQLNASGCSLIETA